MNSQKNIIVIGNSSGIGLELTRRFLQNKNSNVVGISKSASSLTGPGYTHFIDDVADGGFEARFARIVDEIEHVDLCVYCAGVGGEIDLDHLEIETLVFKVNLMAAVIVTNIMVSKMKAQGRGHFIGLSSIADSITSARVPSYGASKVGISYYWEGLGQAISRHGVFISNIRFGYVDTKMAKDRIRPMMMTVDRAVDFVEGVIESPRIRATKPLLMDFLARCAGLFSRLRFLGQ